MYPLVGVEAVNRISHLQQASTWVGHIVVARLQEQQNCGRQLFPVSAGDVFLILAPYSSVESFQVSVHGVPRADSTGDGNEIIVPLL